MKLTAERPFQPETAARKPVEIAASIASVQDGRIYIEEINAPFLYALKAARGWRTHLRLRYRAR